MIALNLLIEGRFVAGGRRACTCFYGKTMDKGLALGFSAKDEHHCREICCKKEEADCYQIHSISSSNIFIPEFNLELAKKC